MATTPHTNSSQWGTLRATNTEAHRLKDGAICLRHSKGREDLWDNSRTRPTKLHAVLLLQTQCHRCQLLRTWAKQCQCSKHNNMEATPSTIWADNKYTTLLLHILLQIPLRLGKPRTRSESRSCSLSLTNSQTSRRSNHESSSAIPFQAVGRSIQSAPSGASLKCPSLYPPISIQRSFLYPRELQK